MWRCRCWAISCGAIDSDVIGKGLNVGDNQVDNQRLIEVNSAIRNHPVEQVGTELWQAYDRHEANRFRLVSIIWLVLALGWGGPAWSFGF